MIVLVLLCFASLSGCKNWAGSQSSPDQITQASTRPEGCSERPTGSLTGDGVQTIEPSQSPVSISGVVHSEATKGYRFAGKSGQELSLSTDEDICIWVFTPENQILTSNTLLPVNGNYILQISAPRGTRSFKLTVGLGEKVSEQVSNPDVTVTSSSLPISPASPPIVPSPSDLTAQPQRLQAPGDQSIPKPDSNGDYITRTSYQRWQVVDPDPNGLNCRWSADMPTEWYSPSVNLPLAKVTEWTIVRRFQTGEILTANLTPASFATILDDRDKPWLKVSIGPNEQICLVRANEQFIHPVN